MDGHAGVHVGYQLRIAMRLSGEEMDAIAWVIHPECRSHPSTLIQIPYL